MPLGEGIVLDPFMGSGSTLAAAEHLGYEAIGIERYPSYYEMSKLAIPKLAKLDIESRVKNSDKSNSSSSLRTLFS